MPLGVLHRVLRVLLRPLGAPVTCIGILLILGWVGMMVYWGWVHKDKPK